MIAQDGVNKEEGEYRADHRAGSNPLGTDTDSAALHPKDGLQEAIERSNRAVKEGMKDVVKGLEQMKKIVSKGQSEAIEVYSQALESATVSLRKAIESRRNSQKEGTSSPHSKVQSADVNCISTDEGMEVARKAMSEVINAGSGEGPVLRHDGPVVRDAEKYSETL